MIKASTLSLRGTYCLYITQQFDVNWHFFILDCTLRKLFGDFAFSLQFICWQYLCSSCGNYWEPEVHKSSHPKCTVDQSAQHQRKWNYPGLSQRTRLHSVPFKLAVYV